MNIQEAKQALEKAKEQLNAAVEAAYPRGTIVAATMGRARIEAQVDGYGWEPGMLRVTNLHTGKKRKICAASEYQNLQVVRPA